MKFAALILPALFIDGIQAAITASLTLITAFPGTVGGAAVGCLLGNNFFGSLGCSIGGFVLGLLGSVGDVLAPLTEPVGLMLAFAINLCLSATLGSGLIMLLIICGMYYPRYLLPGGISEIIPGLDIFPGWTALTILCVLRKIKDEKGGIAGAAAAMVTAAAAPSAESITQTARAVDGIRSPEAQINAA